MKSGLTPRFLNCQWATNPAEMKARAIMTPNEFMVNPPMWNNSGYIRPPSCLKAALQEESGIAAYYRMSRGRTGPLVSALS